MMLLVDAGCEDTGAEVPGDEGESRGRGRAGRAMAMAMGVERCASARQ
jgi:hypothetical protein